MATISPPPPPPAAAPVAAVANDDAGTVTVGYPTFDDAPFVNQPILILDGGTENYPIQNKWIRVQLVMEQSSMVARKASRDKRPMGPPTFILMNLYEVHHPVRYTRDNRPIAPPPNCPETQIPATDDLSTYFICIPWLFRVYPPTREEELGRVLRTKGVTGEERIRAQKGDLPKPVNNSRPAYFSDERERDCEDEEDDDDDGSVDDEEDPDDFADMVAQDHDPSPFPRPALSYPYPATAISCHDPRWPAAVEDARDCARQPWLSLPHLPCPINHGPLEAGVDLSREEMAYVQEHLPREHLKFVRTEHGFQDMRSRLQEVSTRKGCLLLNSFSTGGKGYVFVFDNMLFLEEGYWAIRFAVCNIGWTAHSVYCSGERSYGTIADVYTGAIGVYSSKQWPTLPPTSKITEHYATQIKLCHREQAGGKKNAKNSHPPSAKTVATRGKEKTATTKKSRGRQTTSSRASVDVDSPSSYTRRKVAEIRRDAREAKADHSALLPYLGEAERSDREHGSEVEVVRTEPCSPALRAQIMAVTGHGGSTWTLEGWSPSHEESPSQIQDGFYGTMTWDSSSLPPEPRLPYPLVSSIWPNPPSQSYPEAIPARMRAIEGLMSHPSARAQSPVPRPSRPRPQSLQMPYSPFLRSSPSVTHSALSTVTPPPSAVSTSSTPPRPSLPSRSQSWVQYPIAPMAEQAVPPCASSPSAPTHLLQAPSQQGYSVHYPDSNQYRQQPRTAYTEEPMYHHPTFDFGRLHHPPRGRQLVNLYPSPTSPADHETGQAGGMPPAGQ